jgi:nicotinamide-nucleotide amidase
MKPKLEILSQGDELTTGQITGTNSTWLSQNLVQMGCEVTRHITVGDKLDDLTDVLLDSAKRADCCISTGGLGPTTDDLTAEAVAQAFNLPLVFDEIAFGQITGFFTARNREMPDCNRKQAMLPFSSIRLENRTGTAPGFAVEFGRCLFFFLPGVPSEMKQMFFEHIQPMLDSRFVLKPDRLVIIKTIGIGESELQERLKSISIPAQIKLGFRASIGEVEIKLLFPADYSHVGMEKLVHTITGVIGDSIFGVEGLADTKVDLISMLEKLMQDKAYTLTVIETISAGLLTAKLAQTDCLVSALYERSPCQLAAKMTIEFDVENIEKSIKPMAEKILQDSKASMVLIQLVKPGVDLKSNNGKPVTVVIALVTHGQFFMESVDVVGSIERIRQHSMLKTLDFLRRFLQGKLLPQA